MKTRSVLKTVAKIASGCAKLGASSASIFNRYQPNLPNSLKSKK